MSRLMRRDMSTKKQRGCNIIRPGRAGRLLTMIAMASIALSLNSTAQSQTTRAYTANDYTHDYVRGDPYAFPHSAMGTVFAKWPDGTTRRCSGSVYNSPRGNVVVTAGHCLNSGGTNGSAGRWHSDVRFVPARNMTVLNVYPYGVWYASQLWTSTGWSQYSDKHFDWAAFAVPTNASGQRLQDVVGALGWSFGHDSTVMRGKQMMSAGYPGNRDGGRRMWYCTGPQGGLTFLGEPYSPYYQEPLHTTHCGHNGGASGSPYLDRSVSAAYGVMAYSGIFNPDMNWYTDNQDYAYTVWKAATQ